MKTVNKGLGMGRMVWMPAALVAMLAGEALAQPAALDRVPASTAIVVSTPNFGRLIDRVGRYGNEVLKLENAAQQLFMLNMMSNLPGLKRDGSLAMVLYPPDQQAAQGDQADKAGDEMAGDDMGGDEGDENGEGGDDERRFVAVIPVTDYPGMVKGMGGDPAAPITQLKGMGDGEPLWIKKLDGEYAAAGVMRELVEAYDGKAGQLAAHKTALGVTGLRVSEGSDVLVSVNIPALKDKALAALAEGEASATEEGPEAVAAFAEIKKLAEGYFRDTTINVLGVSLGDAGLTFDAAAQFKEGSEIGSFFTTNGSAGANILSLPNSNFLFASSLDLSTPGLKKIFANAGPLLEKFLAAAKAQAEKDEVGGDAIGEQLQSQIQNLKTNLEQFAKIDGLDTIMGYNAAMLGGGGLFSGIVNHARTKDPAAYIKWTQDNIDQAVANGGIEQFGMKMESTYTKDGAEVNGSKVDVWTMKPVFDDQNPNPFVNIALGFFTGASGQFSGYVAKVPSGVVTTMSQNSSILSAATDALAGKNNLGTSARYTAAQKHLQDGRIAEIALDPKTLLELVGTAAAFTGMPLNVAGTGELTPIMIGASGTDSGTHVRLFIGADVMTSYSKIIQDAQKLQGGVEPEGAEGEGAEGGEEGGNPRF